jgi:two-component system, LytTR family, response regulator
MKKAILIDDENNALEVLEMQIKNYCNSIHIIDKANTAQKGIDLIKKHKPDVVFLDIEMPYKNGFDVLNETIDYNYYVIFTTAYDQFAIKAFKYAAIDYLLKPIDIVELQQATEKLNKFTETNDIRNKVEALFSQLKNNKTGQEKIALPIGDVLEFFDSDEILRFESESNYTHAYLHNGKKVTLAKTLKEIEETINSKPFFRVHQSFYINTNYIEKFYKGESAYIIMKDKVQISVSRAKKEEFMATFKKL